MSAQVGRRVRPSVAVVDARVRLPLDRRPDVLSEASALKRQQYDEVLNMGEKLRTATMAVLLDGLREHGVDRAVVHAETEGGEDADALNAATAELVAEHPQLLSGFGTITMPPRPQARPFGRFRPAPRPA